MNLPAGTVTFLLTDVQGSTQALLDAPDAARAALARIHSVLDQVAERHGGVRPVEQGEGDSAVIAFSRATDALSAAAELQRELAGSLVRVRAAVHTGEARAADGRYSGLSLHRCARLRDVAHGGQVLVSQATRELVVDDLALVDLGPHRLRDLRRPERVYQLDTGEEFPPLRSLDEIPNNLPPQHTAFVGRTTELAEVTSLIENERLVTILGSGGCGKSRLAIQAVAQIADRFTDGVWWIDLSAVTDPAFVASVARTALRIREETHDALARYLRDRSLCLAIDNCEHLLDATADFVRAVLDAGPLVRVVTTSREPLAVPGEVLWRVPSMSTDDATRLFVERARLVRRDFNADDIVPTICERLDGIPLAIELAAARVRAMSTTEIARGLDDRFRLLTGGPRGVAARQRTLEASVEWSHDLLSDEERTLFRTLSVFAGAFTRAAADAVQGAEVLDALTSLVDRSLIVADTTEDGARYRMLETIKQYAYEKLQTSGETADARDRHLRYFAALCERAAPHLETPERASWLKVLSDDYDNLRAALEWSSSSERDDAWLGMVTALGPFWVHQADYREALRWTGRAVEATADERSPRRLHILRADGWLAGSLPDYARQAQSVEEGLKLARELGDRLMTGRFLSMQAFERAASDPVEGRERYEEPLAIARELDDAFGIAFCQQMIAAAWYQQDRYDIAEAHLHEADAVISRVGDPQLALISRVSRSWIAHLRGDLAAALRFAEEAMEIARTDAAPLTRSAAIASYGWVTARMGSYEEARDLLAARLDEAREAGVEVAIPWLQLALVEAYHWLGDVSASVAVLEPVVAFAEMIGGWPVAMSLSLYGEALVRAGEHDRARPMLERARDVADRIDIPQASARAASWLARIAADRQEAERLEHEALALCATYGIRVAIPSTLEALGRLAADDGSEAEAARLVSCAAAARDAMRFPVPPSERAGYGALVSRLRHLDAWEEGATLTLDEGIAYVSRARGARGRPTTGWASLTPTELDVVRLATEGLTNPQIGQKLFMSRSTVKSHLSRVYAKLGIASRAELASEATRQDAP